MIAQYSHKKRTENLVFGPETAGKKFVLISLNNGLQSEITLMCDFWRIVMVFVVNEHLITNLAECLITIQKHFVTQNDNFARN